MIARVEDAEFSADRIPIFPLSNVVLFPRVLCPLHIFEPRYRPLTCAPLAATRGVGMTAVVPAPAGAA